MACDADLAVAAASLLVDAGMVPACVAVGDVEPEFEGRLRAAARLPEDCAVLAGADRLQVKNTWRNAPWTWSWETRATSGWRHVCEVPLVRVGFPLLTAPLHLPNPLRGYVGALALLRRLADAFCTWEERGVDAGDLRISRYF